MTQAWLDPFYPIFDSARWLERALPLGVRLVQLRVKDRPEAELRAEIAAARDLCADHGATLVVNDHWRLAIELGCDFVHLGQEDLDDADVGAIRDAGLRLGLSTHDEAELARAQALSPDYIALGPIRFTKLKAMRFAPQGLPRLADWKARLGETPLVAIGGLRAEDAGDVLAAGADIVSAVTDITLDPDPEARLRAWIAATRPQEDAR